MNPFDVMPTSNTHHPTTSITTTAPSQQLFDLQFSPEVAVTDNQQFHYLLQQQQQRSPPQVMYDHRRDSISSSLGTPSRRGQSKAEKRAEHNAIERARREGLNTRFQQLAHVLPNLHHDTRPSKGTIIERTLDFVKDAIQKEERYRHEIKDLRHTNRQLLKQLTHLTTGQAIKNETMDSDDDQVSVRSSPSPTMDQGLSSSIHHHHQHVSSPSSISSGASSSSTSSLSSPPSRIRMKQKRRQSYSQHTIPLNQQLTIPNRQKSQQHINSHTTDPVITKVSTVQCPSSSSSSFQNTTAPLSENWQPPTTSNVFWSQQPTSSSSPIVSFNLSAVSPPLEVNSSSISMPHALDVLFNNTTQPISSSSSMYPAPISHSGQYIRVNQEDIDMKPCDFNMTLIKEEEHQHNFMPTNQDPIRLSTRPSQSLSQYC